MIYVVNKQDKIVGMFKNNNAASTPFYNDIHNTKIADSDSKIWSETLEFEAPYGHDSTELLDEGIQLLKQDSTGKWKMFTIYQVEDEINDITHTKKVYAINSCIWDLNHTKIDEKTWIAANSRDVFPYIFQRSGWTLENFNDFFSGGTKSFEIAEGKAQAALDEATKAFEVEVEAYVVIQDGNVLDKRVQLVDRLGNETGQRFEYRHNLKGAIRRKSNDEFYTKLFVYGGTNSKGERVSIQSANKVKVQGTTSTYEYVPYLLDEDANDKFNDGRKYLEGYIVNEDIKKPEGLLTWGKTQLQYYNHPHYEYEIDVAVLGHRPDIGDTIAVIDHEMQPALTVSARVLETNYSESNPNDDSVVLGEYKTINAITPNLIWELKALANQALQRAEEKYYRVEIYTPNGLDFELEDETKQVIVRVYDGTTLITDSIPANAYIWQKIDKDGLRDTEWEERYKGKGNVITVGIECADSTIRCLVEGEVSIPIVFTQEADFQFFCKLQNEPLGMSDFNYRVAQYAQVDPINQHIYWTQLYSGSLLTADEIAKGESFSITRTDMTGAILDRMVCKWGGHGSHFGIENKDGKLWIYTSYRDMSASSKTYYVVKFPYQPGKFLKFEDNSVIKISEKTYPISPRINVDIKNGYVLMVINSADETQYLVMRKSTFDTGKFDYLYGLDASYFGVTANQTYQSSALDFPYIYTTFGGADGTITNGDYPVMYCIDIRTFSVVYKINYDFTHDIRPSDDHHEVETIGFYYDGDTKYIIQGFAFTHDNEEYSRKNNMLYRAIERKREDAV